MERLGDFLECSVCLETLDSNHKVLPCQHTFCVPCLQDVAKKGRPQSTVEGGNTYTLPGFLCPECRTPVETPVDRLPSNVILNRLLEGLQGGANPSTPPAKANVQNLAQAAAPPLPLLQASRFHPPRVGPLAPPPPLPPNHSRTTGSLVAPSSSAALVRPTSFQPALEPVPSAYPGVTGYLATNPFLSMLTPPSSQGGQTISQTSSASSSATSSPESPQVPALPPKPVTSAGGPGGVSGPSLFKPKTPVFNPSSSSKQPHTLPLSPESEIQRYRTEIANPTTKTKEQPPPLPPPSSASTSANFKRKECPPAPGPKSGAVTSSSSFGSKPQIPQIYRALYDYHPNQLDELALRKNELYSVIEKCQDGWFKGSSLVTLKTGVFPGNYVVHVNEHMKMRMLENSTQAASPSNATGSEPVPKSSSPTNFLPGMSSTASGVSTSKTTSDLIDFGVYGAVPSSSDHADKCQRSSNSTDQDEAAKEDLGGGDRYEVVETFPASNEYELDLKRGDVVIMVKQRDDGWCKGYHLKSKKQGVFPISFVKKMRL